MKAAQTGGTNDHIVIRITMNLWGRLYCGVNVDWMKAFAWIRFPLAGLSEETGQRRRRAPILNLNILLEDSPPHQVYSTVIYLSTKTPPEPPCRVIHCLTEYDGNAFSCKKLWDIDGCLLKSLVLIKDLVKTYLESRHFTFNKVAIT